MAIHKFDNQGREIPHASDFQSVKDGTKTLLQALAEKAGAAETHEELMRQLSIIEQFKSAMTNQVNNYPMTTINGDVQNAPDEEDITQVQTPEGKSVLRLKDRGTLNGMGYVILRPNFKIVNGVKKNVLEQSMINLANTIYEIRYDFELDGRIELKSKCILNFNGGSLRDGFLEGNFFINATSKCFYNVKLNIEKTSSGNPLHYVQNNFMKLSWFCSESDTDEEKTIAMEYFLGEVLFSKKILDLHNINLTRPVPVNRDGFITGLPNENASIVNKASTAIVASTNYSPVSKDGYRANSLLYIAQTCYTRITHINFFGRRFPNPDYKVGIGIHVKESASFSGIIENCAFHSFYLAAIALHASEYGRILFNYAGQNGCFVYASPYDIDEDNILSIDTASNNKPLNLLYIVGNYTNRNNYGIVFYSGTDIHILNNCISHTSMYGIYGMCSAGSCRIDANYFEGCGESDFWLSKNGYEDTENSVSPYIARSHKGEFNKVVTGWGVGDENKRIRSVILIYGTNSRGYVTVTNSFLSGGYKGEYARNKISLPFLDDQSKIGVDSFVTAFSVKNVRVENVSLLDDGNAYKYLVANPSAQINTNLDKYEIHINSTIPNTYKENGCFSSIGNDLDFINLDFSDGKPNSIAPMNLLNECFSSNAEHLNLRDVIFDELTYQNDKYYSFKSYNHGFRIYSKDYNKGIVINLKILTKLVDNRIIIVRIKNDKGEIVWKYSAILNHLPKEGFYCLPITLNIPKEELMKSEYYSIDGEYQKGGNDRFYFTVPKICHEFEKPIEANFGMGGFTDDNGYKIRGLKSERPTIEDLSKNGFRYFCTDEHRYIVWDTNIWYYEDGVPVV